MQFFSPVFLIFLFVVLTFLAVPFPLRIKKLFLTVASCLFYAAWDYRYLGLLLLVSGIDYICARKIDDARTKAPCIQKRWLTFSVVSNLAILGYFKYCDFFLSNLNGLLEPLRFHFPLQSVLLPAGISFYTFKSMSYTIDVYRKHIEPQRKYLDYAMFITFFPELIAGPIVRASVFLPQMTRDIGPSFDRLASGASLFLLGLTKKRLIADHVSGFVDQVFKEPASFDSLSIWMGCICYSIQIYCDFSGYSDMAIGVARMIGYDLPENFNLPYLSSNIQEFWRRWHITLSSWLRDYLYIPLGGNKKGTARTFINLGLTMLLGGLWHGASWNFVIWGALHGAALACHKAWKTLMPRHAVRHRGLSIFFTFTFVTICWVFFRAPQLGTALFILKKLFMPTPGAFYLPAYLIWILPAVGCAHFIGALANRMDAKSVKHQLKLTRLTGFEIERNQIAGASFNFNLRQPLGTFILTFWILVLFFFSASKSSPFIYFRF